MLIVKIAITTTAAILYLLFFFPALRSCIIPSPWRTTSPAVALDDDASFGAVASESSICSTAGIDMLKRGGNAADAVSTQSHQVKMVYSDLVKMVATVFCVGVIGNDSPASYNYQLF